MPFGAWATVKGGLRPSLGRFACRSPCDSAGTPRGGALPTTGKAALLKYTEENGLRFIQKSFHVQEQRGEVLCLYRAQDLPTSIKIIRLPYKRHRP